MNNQNMQIEEMQTIQWPTENNGVTADDTKNEAVAAPLVAPVVLPLSNHIWYMISRKDGIMIATHGTHPY